MYVRRASSESHLRHLLLGRAANELCACCTWRSVSAHLANSTGYYYCTTTAGALGSGEMYRLVRPRETYRTVACLREMGVCHGPSQLNLSISRAALPQRADGISTPWLARPHQTGKTARDKMRTERPSNQTELTKQPSNRFGVHPDAPLKTKQVPPHHTASKTID